MPAGGEGEVTGVVMVTIALLLLLRLAAETMNYKSICKSDFAIELSKHLELTF